MLNADKTPVPLSEVGDTSSPLGHELGKQEGAGKYLVLVPLFDLKVLNACAATDKGISKSAALVAIFQQRPHRSSRVRQSNAMRRRVLLHNGTHFA
jgi:hypothetical protein